MNSRNVAVASALALLGAACTSRQPDVHLVGKSSADVSDIQITGNHGTATWSWGPNSYKQDLTVIEDGRAHAAGVEGGGSLKLKLEDGTTLDLAGKQNVWVCHSGCDGAHMPIAWVLAAKD